MAKKLNIYQEEFAYKKYVGSLYSIGDNLSLSQKVMNSLLLKKKKIKTTFFCYLNFIFKYTHKKNLKLPINFKYNLSTDFKVKLSRYKEFLQRNNYVFIDNFLEKESYDTLLKTWPKEFYFDPLGKNIMHTFFHFIIYFIYYFLTSTFRNFFSQISSNKFI